MRIEIKETENFSVLFESIMVEKLNRPVTGISIDSRNVKENDLFVAIQGTQFDGHSFIKDVHKLGVSCAIVKKADKDLDLQQVIVKDPISAIILLAEKWREQFKIPIICITGSNGKTSTKELLVHLLINKFKVHSTTGNHNTQIGLSMTILNMSTRDEVSILEIGASAPNEIQNLCEIAKPTHGMITNISSAHLEGFGSIDTIAFEKGALFRYLLDGVSFVNQADSMISKIEFSGKKISYGLTPNCDFPADICQEKNGDLTLILDTQELPTFSKNLSFLKNSIAASAIAVTLGLGWKELKNQLKSFTPPEGRCNIRRVNDITIIDDTYNANLESTLSSIHYLKAISKSGRKIFVFGDMYELGASTNEQHKQVGDKCSDLDLVYTLGIHSKITSKAIRNNIPKKHFSSKEELIISLKKTIKAGDKILFKGSRGMAMEKVIKGTFQI